MAETRTLHWGNTVNGLMTAVPGMHHVRALAAVAQRKLWLCKKEDVLVVPQPLSSQFFDYVASLIGDDITSVKVFSPPGPDSEFLAERLENYLPEDEIRALWQESRRVNVSAFALDESTLNFLRKYDLKHVGYDELPDDELLQFIYDMNTKSGFRRVAAALGIPTTYGHKCSSRDELCHIIDTDPAFQTSAMIKFDRSSNGYGNIAFVRETWEPLTTSEVLTKLSLIWPEQPENFIIEQLVETVQAPSIEVAITGDGPVPLYNCDQRCVNNSWRGMVTPPPEIPAETLTKMERFTDLFAEFAFQRGYRGVLDVDFLLSKNGEFFATETNFRRTGGTFIDELLKRLNKKGTSRDTVWLADAQTIVTPMDFRSLTRLIARNGLAFDPNEGLGVILTSDTLTFDGQVRYVISAETTYDAYQIETDMFRVLGM